MTDRTTAASKHYEASGSSRDAAAARTPACGLWKLNLENRNELHHLESTHGTGFADAGATTLYRRIEGAARLSCGYVGRSLFEQSEWKICCQQAIADTVAKVDSPLLTAVYNRERPESSATAMLHR